MALENAERAACTQRFLDFLQPCGNYGHQLMIYIMDLRPGSFSTFLSQYQESYSEGLGDPLGLVCSLLGDSCMEVAVIT
jgi:hypothetical protein